MPRRLLPFLVLLLTLAVAGPARATPAPRYASPTGTSAADCTTPATACDIRTAIVGTAGNLPAGGQEVILQPGTYELTQTLNPAINTVIHGASGQPRPVIHADGFAALYPASAFSLQISDVAFDIHNVGGADSINTSGATFDRVLIQGDSGGNLCQCYNGTIRDSVILDTAPSGAAWGINSNGGTSTETLRNDTFIATQPGANATQVNVYGAPASPTTIDAKNLIARNTGGGTAVSISGAMTTMHLAYSDFAGDAESSGGVLQDDGHNVGTPPMFVDLAGGDVREMASSPTVDAGLDDAAANGSTDFDGQPRQAGSHTDIGALEYQPPAAIAAAGGSGGSAVPGHVFSPALAVKVTDAQGGPVQDVTVTFTAPASGATGSFPGGPAAQATTGADGIATAPAFTAGHALGSYQVTAGIAEIPATAALPLQNIAGPPAAITAAGGGDQVAAVGGPFAQALAVKVTDAQGYPVASAVVTFTAPGTGATGVFSGGPAAQVASGPDGLATAPMFTAGHTAGSYNVIAAVSQGAAPVAFALRNQVGPTAALQLTPAAASVPAARAQTYSVTGTDAFGNRTTVTPPGVQLTVAPSGATCRGLACSSLRPGTYHVTATAGPAHGAALLHVTALPPRLSITGRSVIVSRRTRIGKLAARCVAPAGEICTVRGSVTVRVGKHRRLLTLATLSGRLRAGTAGVLLVKAPPKIAATLTSRGRSGSVALRVSDVSGAAVARRSLTLRRAPTPQPHR